MRGPAITEAEVLQPLTPYGATKAAAEILQCRPCTASATQAAAGAVDQRSLARGWQAKEIGMWPG